MYESLANKLAIEMGFESDIINETKAANPFTDAWQDAYL